MASPLSAMYQTGQRRMQYGQQGAMPGAQGQMPQPPPGYGQPQQAHGPKSIHESTTYLRGQIEPKLTDRSIDRDLRRDYLKRYSLLDDLHENAARKQQLLEVYRSGELGEEDLYDLDLAMEEVTAESRRIETELATLKAMTQQGGY
jgi:hypothetical protein